MDFLIRYAFSFIGIPYKFGGKNPISGMDCSGLVSEILKSAGVIPGSSDMNAQAIYDSLEPTATANVYQAGSIVFYGASVVAITHTAFLIDPYRAIGADGGDHTTLLLQDAAAKGAFVKIRPIKYRQDIVAILKPNYATIGLVS